MPGPDDALPPEPAGPVHAAAWLAVSVPGRRTRYTVVLACGAEPEDVASQGGDWIVDPAPDDEVDCGDCRVEMELNE